MVQPGDPVDTGLSLRLEYIEAEALLRLLRGWESQAGDDARLDGVARSLVHKMKMQRKRLAKR